MTLTLAAMRAGANRLSCPFRARGELTPKPGIRQACRVRDDEARAVSGLRGRVPDGGCSTAQHTVRLGMGSGGTHSGQCAPYPPSPRVGTLLGMCTDQVDRLLPSLRVANMTAEPARIDYASVFPAGVRAMVGLQRAVDAAGIEPLLLELVKMRASQINGCAYCLDMHSKDARALGESEQRLHLLAAWREAALLRRAGAGGVGLV